MASCSAQTQTLTLTLTLTIIAYHLPFSISLNSSSPSPPAPSTPMNPIEISTPLPSPLSPLPSPEREFRRPPPPPLPSLPEASEDADAAATVAEGDDDEQEEEIRRKIAEEAALAEQRVPRFLGLIDFPRAEPLDPPRELRLVLSGDDRLLRRTLDVRRRVAAETLKDSMSAGKLNITYSTNLVSKMSDFVDRLVIEVATMKEVPEFSHLSFNARAKSCIQDSGVVPLIKWFKHNSMTYPQIGKVISMCTGNLEIIRHITE